MSNLLFVDHSPVLGGAEKSLLLLLAHLDRQQWQPHLVGVPGDLLEEAARLGISVYPMALPRLRRSARFPADWLGMTRSLARLATQLNSAALVANTVRAAIYCAPAGQIARRPFIWYMRDFWLGEGPGNPSLDYFGKWLLGRSASRIITNSQAVAAHLPPSPKIVTILNGLDLAAFDPQLDGQAFRQQFQIPLDVPLVGMVGRLRPWKGQTQFLEMAAKIAKSWPQTHFVIIGGDPFEVGDGYPGRVQQLATELGLDHCLTFTGQLQDVRPGLAALDIFVHPGQPEPFGLVNIEAMAMSRPVVAFRHGALPEIVVEGQTGLLVAPNDEASLAQTVLRLLKDERLQQQMGMSGRERALSHFSIHRVVSQFQATLLTTIPPHSHYL